MDIFEKLKEMAKQEMDMDISLETRLKEDLDLDSIGLLEFVMQIEDEFGIELPDEGVEDIKTIADAVKLIEGVKGENR